MCIRRRNILDITLIGIIVITMCDNGVCITCTYNHYKITKGILSRYNRDKITVGITCDNNMWYHGHNTYNIQYTYIYIYIYLTKMIEASIYFL